MPISSWASAGSTIGSHKAGTGQVMTLSGWRGVSCDEPGQALLVADPGPPVRVTEDLPPRRTTRARRVQLVVDFGQNLTGWCRLTVDQPLGADIRVRHGEALGTDGSVYLDNLGTARQADSYTTVGGPGNPSSPRSLFTAFGMQRSRGFPASRGRVP